MDGRIRMQKMLTSANKLPVYFGQILTLFQTSATLTHFEAQNPEIPALLSQSCEVLSEIMDTLVTWKSKLVNIC